MKKLIIITTALLLTFATISFAAEAQTTKKNAPIDITSDFLEAKDGDIIFIGNVHAIYGDMDIDSDKMTITYETLADDAGINKQEVKELIATGNVELVQNGRYAWGEKLVYVRSTAVAVLTGSPRVKEKNTTMAGDVIRLFLNEDKVKIEGNVKAIMTPEDQKGK